MNRSQPVSTVSLQVDAREDMSQVLIIDDDPLFAETLSKVIQRAGHQPTCVHSLEEGLESVNGGQFDLVFLDVRMPGGSGLELLPKIRKVSQAPEVVIVTGLGDPDGAELDIKNGAWDYIEKGTSSENVILTVRRALEFRQSRTSRTPFAIALKRDRIIGNSPAMVACLEELAHAAYSEASVLISGETGTGKEIFAAAIHQNSSRAEKPLSSSPRGWRGRSPGRSSDCRPGRPRVEGEAVERAHAALGGGASLRGAMQASGASMAVVRRLRAAVSSNLGGKGQG